MCDTYLSGHVSRISPEAPVPVFESTEKRHVLGGAANVAANLRALGCEVRLAGVVGDDVTGRYVREQVRAQGIADDLLVQDGSRPTTEKTRLIARHQQLAVNVPIFVDPKARDFAQYRGATVLTPNLAEVRHATGDPLEEETSLATAAESLLRQSEAQALLVTRGEAGMSLFHPPQAPQHLPAHTRDVYDVTGAGDTVIAAFAAAAIGGLSYAEAARLANVAAGIVVGKAGTAVAHREELEAHLGVHSAPWQSKLRTCDELSRALQQYRQRGERVVFTNGDDRPLRPQDERARMLAALACVDYVVPFGEATPLALIKSLKPDVLVKGSDYTLETVVGREEVEASGGSVHLIPYIEGVSTTELIDELLQRYR
ncbi:Bifunctional protein HldE [Geodia barretti]|uniref:Bifunctional protein HldE n=1 Tax=Geodia barretti TaxID=519541 RepID=A0AA35QY51_GEOBA|nr:Bifunctional protein HldE [Geodia barretti]